MTPSTLFEAIRSLKVDPNSPEFISIGSAVLFHVIGVEDAYACQRSLNALVDFNKLDSSGQKFRLLLSGISYIHLDIKFFALSILKYRNNARNLKTFGNMFGINRNDIVLISKILKQRGVTSKLKSHKTIRNINKSMISLTAYKEVHNRFSRIHPAVMAIIKKVTYKKLRFISVSNNIEFYDLHMELLCKALKSYIKIVPTEEPEARIVGYIKTAIESHALNLITSYTTHKRKRMVQGVADGYGGFNYEILMLSENQMLRAFGVEGLCYENMQSTEANQEEERIRESNLSYELILKRFGTTTKKTVFIKLISLQEHTKFTSFLIDNKLIKQGQDNVDYHNNKGEKAYFEAICNYLRINIRSAKNFMGLIAKVAYPEETMRLKHEH